MDRRMRIQSGRGLGGIFSSLFKFIRPLATTAIKKAVPALKKVATSKVVKQTFKNVGKSAKKSAIRTAVDALSDLADGRDPKQTIIRGARNTAKKTIKKTAKNLSKQISDNSNNIKKKSYVKNKNKKRKSIYI